MMKFTILAITIALTNAQTSTDAPVRDIIITATFIGDLGTTSVEDQATIITAVSAQVSDAFGVSPDAVSTTLASGSIVATSVITGPTIIPYSAPVILVSALGLTATGVEVNEIESEIETPEFNVGSGYRTGEGGSKGGEGGKGGERGSKGGERGNGERGSKGGERGSKGSVSTGSTSSEKGSGGSEKGSGEKGSGKGQGTGESGKGSGSAMTASNGGSVSRGSVAGLSAAAVLIAGVGLMAVRKMRRSAEYTHVNQVDPADPVENTPLMV